MASTYNKSFISKAVDSQPKRIVICCDGTWQSATSLEPTNGCSSNVARLCRVLAKAGIDKDNKVWQQIVYYDAGVGTGDITDFEKKRQGGLGLGLIENFIEAYNFIASNYNVGDQLFFFGFSRGAYTVRSAAGLISQVGVLKPESMSTFIRYYNEYIHAKDHKDPFKNYKPWVNFVQDKHYIAAPGTVITKVIGVWDTVGSLGVPDLGHYWTWNNFWSRKKYEFHDTELNDTILNAYQALALDERRAPFSPSVWKVKNGAKTNLCQCWFPGAHVNIGGGSSNTAGDHPTDDKEQLASISYAWMLDRIRPHLALDNDALSTQLQAFEDLAKDLDILKEPEPEPSWIWKPWYYAKGYAAGKIDDSYTLAYKIMGKAADRTPGGYHNLRQQKDGSFAYDGSIGEYTVERIHPCVYFRQEANKVNNVPKYIPAAMKGWEREYREGGYGKHDANGKPTTRKGWAWVKYKDPNDYSKGVAFYLWEFEIGHMPEEDSVEKRLIDVSWVKKIHDEVHDGWISK